MAGSQGSPLPIYYALQETKGNQDSFLAVQFPTYYRIYSTI